MFTVELGSKAKSKTLGLVGTVTSRSENVYGCNRYYVQPSVGKEMKVPDGYWVDEDDVTVLKKPTKLTKPRKKTKLGGPVSRIK